MALRLYNTLGRKIQDFSPRRGTGVGLYTCGPTVYSTAHLGNLRTYIFEDVLRRTLEFNGYKVKQVMNVTDVGHLTDDGDMGEDKIEKAAKLEKKSAWDIAQEHETEFFRDLERLNVLKPSGVLRATEHIDLQIELIKKLETKGVTYRISDGIYFDTSKFPTYGQLSGQTRNEKRAGARVEVNTEKRHPSDFALWKFSKPEDKRQMEWPSPWGVGFPGWHIECSAMSISQFPRGLDIHCGGIDHIAVHHENEIAQNEAAGHKDFVKIWMHGEFLVLPGQRMGKSEGNSITLPDVIGRGIHPLAFRYLCLQSHYRAPLSFTWESLTAASTGLNNLWLQIDTNGDTARVGCAEFEERFHAVVDDDLNTPQALAITHELLKSDYPWHAKRQSLSVFDTILGLDLLSVRASQWIEPTPELQVLLDNRENARREKKFSQADEVRKKLLASGFVVDDTPDGPRLRKA